MRARKVVVLDNLVYGHREALEVSEGVTFVEGDMGDRDFVETVFSENDIGAVLHFAAYCYVGESVEEPIKYYDNNTAKPLVLLDAMRRHEVKRFILSSTCATYGDPQYLPLDENHQQSPVNPYGWSKYMLERIIRDCGKAYGIEAVFLRYFNASGCASDGAIGEDHDPESHLIPLVLMAIKGESAKISPSSEPIGIRRMAPACAITFTWRILHRRTSRRSAISVVVARLLV